MLPSPTDDSPPRNSCYAPAKLLAIGLESPEKESVCSISGGYWHPGEPATGEIQPDLQTLQKNLPGYELRGLVGAGGMGAVLAADQKRMCREVALKVVRPGMSPGARLRFLEEAKITAQLQHPHIVPVHEIATGEGGEPYYTMKLVRGCSLAKVLHDLAAQDSAALAQYPLAVLLTIFQKACDAIAFAHSRGVVHRDLKPENIMLGDFGEVLVMDWGLAKVVGRTKEKASATEASIREEGGLIAPRPDQADPSLSATVVSERRFYGSIFSTMDGAVLGTPHYMAPEQARGEVNAVDERTDIYSLGAILHHILVLRPPVSGDTPEEIVSRVALGELDLQEIRGGAESLAAVMRKAMAFEPACRYASVLELQREIAAYQSGFATAAERAGLWRQFRLLVQRHRGASIGAAAAFLVGTLLGIQVLIEGRRAQRNAIAEAAQRAEAERLVRFVSGDLKSKLEAVGRVELLHEAVREVERYYEKFPSVTSAEGLFQEARNKENRAELELVQGRPSRAFEVMKLAVALHERACGLAPMPEYKIQRAYALSRLAHFARLTGKPPEAERAASDALAILKAVSVEQLENPQRALAATATQGVYIILRTTSKATEMAEALYLNQRIADILHASAPNDPEARIARARQLMFSLSANQREEAWRRRIEDARDIITSLLAEQPSNRKFLALSAETELLTVMHLQMSGYDMEAQENAQKALRIFEQLQREEPSNLNIWTSIYDTHSQLGYLKKLFGRERNGEAHWQAMLRIAEDMIERSPGDVSWESHLQFACYRWGESRLSLSTPEEALHFFHRSKEILFKLNPESPLSMQTIYMASLLTRFMSMAELKLNRLDQALAHVNEAIELVESRGYGGVRDRATGYLYRHRSQVLTALQRHEEAERDAAEAVKHFRLERRPHMRYIAELEYGRAVAAHGQVLIKLGRNLEADTLLAEAMAVFGRMLREGAHQRQVFEALQEAVRRRYEFPENRADTAKIREILNTYSLALKASVQREPENQARIADLVAGLKSNARRARQLGDEAYASEIEQDLQRLVPTTLRAAAPTQSSKLTR
jgi:serine/threonine protein kinase